MTDTVTKPDIITRLSVARECRISQGLPADLFADAIAEIIRLRSIARQTRGEDTSSNDLLIDVDEVAGVLGLDPTKVYVHSVRDFSFPQPAAITGHGPQWRRGDIERWADLQPLAS